MAGEELYIPRIAQQTNPGTFGSDLQGMLGGLADSVNTLHLQNAISQANDQVQQAQLNGASDSEIRKLQLQNANQLGQMSMVMGFPVNHTQLLMNQFAPPKPYIPQNLAEMQTAAAYEQANNPGGVPGPHQVALKNFLQQQSEMQNLKNQKTANPLQQKKLSDAENKTKSSLLKDVAQKSDIWEQTSRNVLGTLQNRATLTQDLQSLIGNPSGWQQKTMQHIQELATGYDRIIRGGVATEGGTAGLIPRDAQMQLAKLRQYATSSPTPANQAGFVQLYSDMTDRLGDVVNAQIHAGQKTILKSRGFIAKQYPDDFADIGTSVLKGEKVSVDNGKVNFESDVGEGKVQKALQILAQNPDVPNAKAVFENIRNSPNYWSAIMTNAQAASQVRMLQGRFYGGK